MPSLDGLTSVENSDDNGLHALCIILKKTFQSITLIFNTLKIMLLHAGIVSLSPPLSHKKCFQ